MHIPSLEIRESFQLTNALAELIAENKMLIEEIRSLRGFFKSYDEASTLFGN